MQKTSKPELGSYLLLLGTLAFTAIKVAPHDAMSHPDKVETYAAIGTILFAVLFLVLRIAPRRRLKLERALYAVFLACMPLVYLVAALISRADPKTEMIGVVIFVSLAAVGYFKAFAVLPIAILAHGFGWDLWHHDPAQYGYIATWYPPACLLTDIALGLLAVAQISAHQVPNDSLQATSLAGRA